MYPPYPAPLSPSYPHPVRDFFIGVGLGLIPGILYMIAIANKPSSACNVGYKPPHCSTPPTPPVVDVLFNASCTLWVAALVVLIVLFSIKRTRFIGLGMFITWLIDTVVPFIGCLVIVPA